MVIQNNNCVYVVFYGFQCSFGFWDYFVSNGFVCDYVVDIGWCYLGDNFVGFVFDVGYVG